MMERSHQFDGLELCILGVGSRMEVNDARAKQHAFLPELGQRTN